MNGQTEGELPADPTQESEALLGLVNYWQGLKPHERVMQAPRLKRDAIACTEGVYQLALATADDESERLVLARMRAEGFVVVGRRAVAKAHARLASAKRRRRR
jgi:hypothetical protein